MSKAGDDDLRALLGESLVADGDAPASKELLATAEAVSRWAAVAAPRLRGPAAPRPALVRERLLATVASAERFRPFFATLTELCDLDAAGLRAVLAKVDAPGDAGWMTAPFPGVRYLDFAPGPAAGVTEAGLVRVAAGATFPTHQHVGRERACVLEGTVLLEGRRYHPGDLIESAAGTSHQFQAGPARDVVLLVAHSGIAFRPRPRAPGSPQV